MKSILAALTGLIGVSSAALGVTYTPYTTQSGCKTAADIAQDFTIIYNHGNYSTVRLYDSNCNSVATIIQTVKAHKQDTALFVGVGTVNFDNLQGETQAIIEQVNGDWSMIRAISVGNEGLGSIYTASNIQGYVTQVKTQLQKAGYTGPVVNVNIFYQYLPQSGGDASLCDVGDYVACNIQPFYDGNVAASEVGSFVTTQHQNVVNACGGKKVLVTEAGWPSAGNDNGPSVPSPANQASAVHQLHEAFESGVFIFSAFNEYWKSPGEFNVEQHFGFLGNSPSSGP